MPRWRIENECEVVEQTNTIWNKLWTYGILEFDVEWYGKIRKTILHRDEWAILRAPDGGGT